MRLVVAATGPNELLLRLTVGNTFVCRVHRALSGQLGTVGPVLSTKLLVPT